MSEYPGHARISPFYYSQLMPYMDMGRNPKVCLKCNGEGTDEGVKRLLNPTAMNCWPCSGTGILWEP